MRVPDVLTSAVRSVNAPTETPNERERREEDELLASLQGRTIVGLDRIDNSDSDGTWLEGVTLTLDDGRTIGFSGWGHDWWGLTIGIAT